MAAAADRARPPCRCPRPCEAREQQEWTCETIDGSMPIQSPPGRRRRDAHGRNAMTPRSNFKGCSPIVQQGSYGREGGKRATLSADAAGSHLRQSDRLHRVSSLGCPLLLQLALPFSTGTSAVPWAELAAYFPANIARGDQTRHEGSKRSGADACANQLFPRAGRTMHCNPLAVCCKTFWDTVDPPREIPTDMFPASPASSP